MKKKHAKFKQTDGVSQRQSRRTLGDFSDVHKIQEDTLTRDRKQPINKTVTQVIDKDQGDVEIITEQDIIENTRSEVDTSRLKTGGWRARRRAKKLARKRKLARRSKRYRIFRKVVRITAFSFVGLLLFFGINVLLNLNNIINRDGDGALALQENILPSQLKGEGDGRVNIMLLGIGGETHVAGNLADSIMIASIDPFANELALLSIPRDMYVTVPGYYSTRINAAHSIGEEQDHPGGGIALMQETLEEVLDINIHYYVRVDFQGFREAVDTVGGVTINLEEPVYDPNFDWEFGTNALNLPAGDVTLDGQTALLLARARGASGIGIGVSRGDFGRGDQQRKILIALKDKVLSLGTFANPVKITQLLNSAGNHVRTNLSIGEMLAVYEIMERIPQESIISFGLDTNPDNYLAGQNIDGAAVLVPKSGDYTDIQLFVRELFVDGFIRQEKPVLDVYNGTLQAGLATETGDDLNTYGYTINIVDNADKQNYAKSQLYDLSAGEKPFTKALLENRFNTKALPASQLPTQYKTTEADFVIIIGDDYVTEETTF